MANLKKFSNIETTGIPDAPIQQFAVNTSEATRKQGTSQLVSTLVEAGGKGFQAVDAALTNQKVRNLIGDSSEIPSFVKPAEELTAEEASFLNFKQIADARARGMSADRAAVAASTRLQQAIARDPRRAEAFKSAFNNFFGGTSTFDKTPSEQAQQDVIKFGLSKFGLDPRLAHEDPQAWERKFQSEMTLFKQQEEIERLVNISDADVKLTQNEQQSALPTFVSSALTNADSQLYIPGNIDSVLSRYTTEGGQIDTSRAVGIQQELEVQRQATLSGLRAKFSALSPSQFESITQPINEYYDMAIEAGNGDMELAALERENKIFREAAQQSMFKGSPEAAKQWIGITELIGDLEIVSPTMVKIQEKLANQLLSAMPALLNPTKGTAAGDILNEDDLKGYNTMLSEGLKSANKKARFADGPTRQRIGNTISLNANEIINNPNGVKASTYTTYFSTLLNPDIMKSLTEEQISQVVESLSSEAMQDYLTLTLDRWKEMKPEEGKLVYNPDKNAIEVLVDKDASGLTRNRAREVNSKMRNSNLYFVALNKFLGSNGEDVLAESDLGRVLLRNSGIEVGVEAAEEAGFEGVEVKRERRRAVSEISREIISGTATEEDINLLESLLQEEEGLRNNPFPKLQDALEILNEREGLTASERAAQPTPENTVPPANVTSSNMREMITQRLLETDLTTSEIEAFFDGTASQEVNKKVREVLQSGE